MKNKKEMQYEKLLEIISCRAGKILSLDSLLKKVNFVLPNDITIKSNWALAMLIRSQCDFKVFRCRFNERIYYIFRKRISEE